MATPTGKERPNLVQSQIPYNTRSGGSKQRTPASSHTLVREPSLTHDDQGGWRDAISNFQEVLEKSLKDLKDSILDLERNLGNAVDFQAKRIDELEGAMKENDNRIKELSEKVTSTEHSLRASYAEINKLERMSRRNNFRIVGIPTAVNENCEDIFFSTVLPNFENAPNISVERCHRDGRDRPGKPPHILVRCLSYKDKVFIMKSCRNSLAGKPYFIVDDLTRTDLKEKRKYSKMVQELYEQGVKLRFFAGRWRSNDGKPYSFN